jgi:hypothetical protein
MLYWPRRSRERASKLLPGGMRNSFRRAIESRCSSLLLATLHSCSGQILRASEVFWPLNRSSVPCSLNDRITAGKIAWFSCYVKTIHQRHLSQYTTPYMAWKWRCYWSRRPNIELSCAAESPARSEPQQRYHLESEDYLRRQLQRFVRSPPHPFAAVLPPDRLLRPLPLLPYDVQPFSVVGTA